MRCAKANQQMHMVGDAANALGNSIRRTDDSAKIRVQVSSPCRLDHWLVIFRSENDVIMQAQMCGWHLEDWFTAPPPGLGMVCIPSPVVCTTG